MNITEQSKRKWLYKIIVGEVTIADVEDPDILIGSNLYKWLDSEVGVWAESHTKEQLYWERIIDHNTYGYRYRIIATLTPEDITYFNLKFK